MDAVVGCWGSEVGRGQGEVRYCREAEWLFGDDPVGTDEEAEGFIGGRR